MYNFSGLEVTDTQLQAVKSKLLRHAIFDVVYEEVRQCFHSSHMNHSSVTYYPAPFGKTDLPIISD
jgi:hypothetical protein